MDFKALGRKIADARVNKGLSHQQLLEKLNELNIHGLKKYKIDKKKAQIARYWEEGKPPPPLATLAGLSIVLEIPEEDLLFEPRREHQLRRESPFIERVNDQEFDLLGIYRSSADVGQILIVEMAKTIAKQHPSKDASAIQMKLRRKRR